MNTIIQTNGLCAAYDGKTVLSQVDLTVYERDFLGVIGPNGGGKTTLIKCILGLHKPSKGQICFYKDGKEVPAYSSSYSCSPPTLVGQAKEVKVGLQFWADDKMVDEVLFSNYQTPVRYTYNVAGAQKFTFKIVAGGRELSPNGVPVLELTVWEGEAHETGHVPSPAGSQPVQLIKDLKPYLIPSTSGAVYYPNATPSSEGRAHINMCGIKYENVMATYVSMGMTENDNEEMFFNLEGKYNYLTFTAGVADRTTTYSEGTAWLTVYADGKMIYEEVYSSHELQKKVTLNISGCHQLVFAWQSDEGNMEYGLSTGNFFGIGDAYVATTEAALNTIQYSSRDLPDRPVKMMSELGAFSIFSNMQDDAVFDGSTQFHTFSMGGVKYNEGIMLHATNTMLMTKPANASFNLDGKYKTISFITFSVIPFLGGSVKTTSGEPKVRLHSSIPFSLSAQTKRKSVYPFASALRAASSRRFATYSLGLIWYSALKAR